MQCQQPNLANFGLKSQFRLDYYYVVYDFVKLFINDSKKAEENAAVSKHKWKTHKDS